MEPELTIGAVAERTGVAPSALRYYEAEGLITAERTDGNQRRYHRDVLRRVSFIQVAQRVGLSLEEIHEALAVAPRVAHPHPRGLVPHLAGVAARASTSRSSSSSG